MTRILVWNLQTFGINKIDDNRPGSEHGYAGLSNLETSQWRRDLIYLLLRDTRPDIIILVEVGSGDSFPDQLCTPTDGLTGCTFLLNYLRTDLVHRNRDWRLVPPLRVGRADGSKPETVAVFYAGQTPVPQQLPIERFFTGPNWWSGAVHGRSVPPGRRMGAYPPAGNGYPDLNALLVPPGSAVRNVPMNALHNPGLPENQLAARIEFVEDVNGIPGNFYLNFGVFRPPYLTTFTEVDPNAGTTHNLTLFAVHAPAVAGDQTVFLSYLASMFDVTGPLGGPLALPETRMIGGDFNLPLLNADGTDPNTYGVLIAKGYTRLLAPQAGPPLAQPAIDAYRGYFGTHLRPWNFTKRSRFLWSDAPHDSPYPGYHYMGSNRFPNLSSIDNLLVWTNQPPAANTTTILNRVVGTPFDRVPPPGAPPGPPIGTLHGQPLFLHNFGVWPRTPDAPVWSLGDSVNLVSWRNYGWIYATSDHFALYTTL